MATPILTTQPTPLLVTPPSRDSMTFTSTKGLLNGPGQNNCFLNSAVQVLWHLDIFRRSFRDLSGHACMADSCIFCALKELFSQLQFSNETALPPDALRRALAESFFDQQRFQLGFMDDAAECFENMLLRIHMHIAHGEAEDMCNAKHCIPHQKFAMTLVEQSVCGSCGATSEPLSYTQMVHYVSTSTLVYQVRNNPNRTQNVMEPFGQLLRKAGSMGDVRVCPSACGAVIQIGRTLMNRPEIVSIGLVWNSERPTLEHIMEVFSTIGTNLRLADVFNTVVDSRWAENCIHRLVGVVTYYGKHYSTFFFHTKLKVWIYFDDATVREVGPRWEQVVEKCRKGRYQPLLLLYALPDGTPVNTDNAPKQITPFYNEKSVKKSPLVVNQSLLKRSITPSPEKPNLCGNTTQRRAITPNPDCTLNQKPPPPPLPLPKPPYSEYQNLSVIQNNLYNNQSCDVVDGDLMKKDPEYITRKSLPQKSNNNIHRTLSNGSSSGTEACFRDYLNVPRTRDSGNWSSDRNSASSSSSTTMENPYLYLVGKVHDNVMATNPVQLPRNESSSSSSSGVYDVGYDSYSLSSNDSSTMTTIQHLMKMGHLAKIPEDYNTTPTQISQSCDVLCDEADELLVKSRQLEDDHDLVLALALCNAAATKARAAMDAPYNNPQTLTLARMKHNTCIMRARSLHRRMTQNQTTMQNKDVQPEIRHTRDGSSGSGSGRHSRQNSRDKGNHSRQNSRELLQQSQQQQQQQDKPPVSKNIEIYATLPKKKDGLKKITINIEDDDYATYDKPPGRESRSIFSRSKNKDNQKVREKRSRSEDRNKITRDFSIAPEIATGNKDTLKRDKTKDDKDDNKKDKDGKNKKQHKIRRKLLMGGLIRRKNRSMPDLTESEKPEKPNSTVDDSGVGLKGTNSTTDTTASMCGYLSEGHLEFTGNCGGSTNPNLERSKLMRKSFHGSAGKILTAAKVPPPPPLRTTSQLSTSKLNSGEVCEDKGDQRPQYPLPQDINYNMDTISKYIPQYSQQYHPQKDGVSFHTPDSNMVVTRADVHQEQNPIKIDDDRGVDEVDCLPNYPRNDYGSNQNLDLPPYPSPMGSVIHSRQASEEFPPPPPPLDLSALDEHIPKQQPPPSPLPPLQPPPPASLLAQLQNRRQEIMAHDADTKPIQEIKTTPTIGGETWLKELQAKQAALRMKKNQNVENCGVDMVDQKYHNTNDNHHNGKVTSSVRDLATKFENIQIETPIRIPLEVCDDKVQSTQIQTVELNNNCEDTTKKKLGKKKSVSFCDQVILVATAEDQEDDSYIPNPILERVLRSAMNNKNETTTQLVENYQDNNYNNNEQPVYVRRNSIENLLSSRQNFNHDNNDNNNYMIYGSSPQYKPQMPQTPSPYQRIPQNSPSYLYNNNNINNNNNNNQLSNKPPSSPNYTINQYNNQKQNGYVYPQEHNPNYRPTTYNQQITQMRQSPSPSSVLHHQNYQQPQQQQQQYHPIYQHPPSPSPNGTNYQYQHEIYHRQNSYENQRQNTYDYRQYSPINQQQQQPNYQPYQTVPMGGYQEINNFQRPLDYRITPTMEQQQRMPPPSPPVIQQQQPPYQHVLPPKQLLKKTVSFEANTKNNGTDMVGQSSSPPIPKAVITPIVVNNANNSIPTGKTKCNLCRKKAVVSVNLYCTDCEFYMSRFKPKR